MRGLVDWTKILKQGGVPEPPGRQQAVEAAAERSRQKAARKARPAKGRKKKTK
tara:strand:- start:590 stop:748 length:159 start_codon:yes stop_codon:yes gene_type:complete